MVELQPPEGAGLLTGRTPMGATPVWLRVASIIQEFQPVNKFGKACQLLQHPPH